MPPARSQKVAPLMNKIALQFLLPAVLAVVLIAGSAAVASETIGRYQVIALPAPARDSLELAFVLVDTATGQSWYMADPHNGVDHPRWMPLRFLVKQWPPEPLAPLPPPPAAIGTDFP
jgi:hypothetical protein